MVVPTYNVATYLPDFLTSLDDQSAGLDGVEVVFVDDGATDESAAIIEDWLGRRAGVAARLVRKENGGLSSARNAGLEVATGEWICFADPDDMLSKNYLGVVKGFLASAKARTVHLVVTKLVYYDEPGGTLTDRHPLRGRFAQGTRVIDMTREPHFVHVGANHAFFRRTVLVENGLRYDPTVVPVWEDGKVTAQYLSRFARPRMAVLAEATYFYRRRMDGSSLMQGAWTSRSKYVDVPRNGWLAVLREVRERCGEIPQWLQSMILYDLFGYFQRERQSPSPTGWVPAELADEFCSLVAEVLTYIDSSAIESYRTNWVNAEVKRALVIGFKGEEQRPLQVNVDRLDRARGVVRLHYYYAGDAPEEEFFARGFKVAPVWSQRRPSRFFGRTLMWERIAWLPANGTVALTLDGKPAQLVVGDLDVHYYSLPADVMWTGLTGEPWREQLTWYPGWRARLGRAKRRVQDLRERLAKTAIQAFVLRVVGRFPLVRWYYRDAWLLIDRDNLANDNAEHFYRYLRKHRRSVNAFFVLRKDSSDWARLKKEGFRLIPFRSPQHMLALQHTTQLLSSQVDKYITQPLPPIIGEPGWKFTFLQHGVTQNDLSNWLNPKPIELMLTATRDEYDTIVAEGSGYLLTGREVRLTGFPRFDRLLELAGRKTPEQRRLLLVMPTWRQTLLLDTVSRHGNERALREDFWHSEYATQWRAVLESERLHKVAASHGWQIEFIPHPNMQRYLDNSPLPEHVSYHRFADVDVQDMFARAGALITDYSSVAFDVAYLERPIVYFQFDQDEFFGGGHAFRRSAWSYEAQGFGPVTTDAESAIDALVGIIERNGAAEPEYARRLAETFGLRDGKSCERVFQAVQDLSRPLPYDQLFKKLETPEELEGSPVVP